mgnify:CR=1 FL=1
MALTELQIKQLKPKEKRYTVSDGRGLILEVHPNGAKYWILRFKVKGKEKRKSLGSFPEVSLKEARVKAVEERGRKPEEKIMVTFGEVVSEWLEKKMKDKRQSYR